VINYADKRIEVINQKIQGLKSKGCAVLPLVGGTTPDEWDATFMQLKGIKGFFDDMSWDEIIKEFPELDWVTNIRSDPTFREYYKLKTDLEELMKLKGV
jgi:hypothetical protein